MQREQKSAGGSPPNDELAAVELKGLTPMEALEQYEGELTPFEMTELSTYKCIYAVGSVRVQSMRQITNRDGFYNATLCWGNLRLVLCVC